MYRVGDLVRVTDLNDSALVGFEVDEVVVVTELDRMWRGAPAHWSVEVAKRSGHPVGYCHYTSIEHVPISYTHPPRGTLCECPYARVFSFGYWGELAPPMAGFFTGDVVTIIGRENRGLRRPRYAVKKTGEGCDDYWGYASANQLILIDKDYVTSVLREFGHDEEGFVHRTHYSQRPSAEQLKFSTEDQAILISDRAGVYPLLDFVKGERVTILQVLPTHSRFPDYKIHVNMREGYCYQEELFDDRIQIREVNQ